MKIKPEFIGRKDIYKARLENKIISRKDFIQNIKYAVENKLRYAAARIGISEQFWMYYPILLNREKNETKRRAFEKNLRFHGYLQAGIFPADPEFYLKYNSFYLDKIKEIDCLGMIMDPFMGLEIIRFHGIGNELIYFKDMRPDRSVPSNPDNSYLPYFRDQRLLIVCPFADLLKKRAHKELFEKVWSKTGKKWFHPEAVESVEFPYGFSKKTQQRYDTALELYESIIEKIEKKEFDVALIAAGGLTVPIASRIKKMGKIAVSLGGEIQILFGVIGERWRNKEHWKRDYFNRWWIDMPDDYRPDEPKACEGAYW